MAYLTVTELARLGTIRPEAFSKLQMLMALFEARTGKKTYVPADGGLRTLARQAELVAMRDASGEDYAVASPELSRHPLGGAFDLHIIDGADGDYRVLADLSRSIGLVPGYYFTPRKDEFHHELNESLAVARAAWATFVKKNSSSWSRLVASLSLH